MHTLGDLQMGMQSVASSSTLEKQLAEAKALREVSAKELAAKIKLAAHLKSTADQSNHDNIALKDYNAQVANSFQV